MGNLWNSDGPLRGVDYMISVTNLSRNGLRDWLIQRITSVILAVYFFLVLGYIICHPGLDYITWMQLFSNDGMKIFTLLALFSLVFHGWIGVWTIITDYFSNHVQRKRALGTRLLLQIFFALLLVVYLFWGIQIIWGL